MQFSTIFVFVSLALTGFAAPNSSAVKQVETCIATIATQAHALDAVATKLQSPSAGFASVMATAVEIEAGVRSLASAIDACTANVEAVPTPVTESEAQTVLAAVQAVEPEILDGLRRLVDCKPVLEGLLVPGATAITLRYVRKLQGCTDRFAGALINSSPAGLTTQCNDIKNSVDKGFVVAIAAFS